MYYIEVLNIPVITTIDNMIVYLQHAIKEPTESTVRRTADIARTTRRVTLSMDIVSTAAKTGTLRMSAKPTFVSQIRTLGRVTVSIGILL